MTASLCFACGCLAPVWNYWMGFYEGYGGPCWIFPCRFECLLTGQSYAYEPSEKGRKIIRQEWKRENPDSDIK